MPIREAHWNCPHCGTAGVPGRDAACPTCGRPRPDGVPLYVAVNEARAADPSVDAPIAPAVGSPAWAAEWTCPYCADRNRPGDLACRGCGAPRTDRVALVEAGPARSRPPVTPSSPVSPASPASSPPLPVDVEQGAGAYRLWMGICSVLLLAMAVGLGISMASDSPVGGEDLVPAVVASKEVVRVVDVERRTLGLDGAWETARSLTANEVNIVPAWPTAKLRRGERMGPRSERYTVTYRRDSGLEHVVPTDPGRWAAMPVGGHVALRVTYADSTEVQVLPADSLSACRRWHLHPQSTPPDSLGCSPAAP